MSGTFHLLNGLAIDCLKVLRDSSKDDFCLSGAIN